MMGQFVYLICLIVLIAITLPLQVVVSLIVLVFCGSPVLFIQERMGRRGKPFFMYKFRTMGKHADVLQQSLRKKNEADGPVFKIRNDPRYTPVGRLLAHTGLDELPQVWNILRGEMAIFGPRPLPVNEAGKLNKAYQKRHAIKPGIISPAILTGRYHEDFDAWMQSDLDYVLNKSVLFDLGLIFRSIVFLGKLVLRELISLFSKCG